MKKKYRLKKNHEIASIVYKKQKYYGNYYIVYYQCDKENNESIPAIAISVSKKYGNAVERNHAKRIVREIIHPIINDLYGKKFVIVIKNGAVDAPFSVLKEDLSNTLLKINKKELKSEQQKS